MSKKTSIKCAVLLENPDPLLHKLNSINNLEIVSSKDVREDFWRNVDVGLILVNDIHTSSEKEYKLILENAKNNVKTLFPIKISEDDNILNVNSIFNSINSIVELITLPNLTKVNIDDLFNLFQTGNQVNFSYGEGFGNNAVSKATDEAVRKISSKLMGARFIIYNVTGDENKISAFEVKESIDKIQHNCKDDVNIIIGVSIENRLEDKVKAYIWIT